MKQGMAMEKNCHRGRWNYQLWIVKRPKIFNVLVMQDNPKATLDLWISRVNELAVEDLLDLYAENAVLLPTFSDALLTGKDGIRSYFEELGGHQGIEVSVVEDSLITQSLSDDLQTIGGIYEWRFGGGDEVVTVEARFTYVLDLSLTSPILHHHSSQLPRKPTG